MLGFLLAPLTEFVELNLFSDEFLVLAGPVIDPLASPTAEFY